MLLQMPCYRSITRVDCLQWLITPINWTYLSVTVLCMTMKCLPLSSPVGSGAAIWLITMLWFMQITSPLSTSSCSFDCILTRFAGWDSLLIMGCRWNTGQVMPAEFLKLWSVHHWSIHYFYTRPRELHCQFVLSTDEGTCFYIRAGHCCIHFIQPSLRA